MTLLPNYKDIVELIKKGATIEAQEKIMELREGALEVQEENIRLREKVKELEDKLNKKENVIWEAPFYWRKDGDKKDGPFCAQCYDKAGNLIRPLDHKNGVWTCPTCKNIYKDSSYRDPSPQSGSHGWDAFT
jgi:formylglycine-generating enzyme required for sulfatase activity